MGATDLAKATAFRQQHLLSSAEQEYRAALKFAPNDLALHLALADTLYDMRRYQDSIEALNAALKRAAEKMGDRAVQQMQKRALAAAARAEDQHEFARLYRQADIVKNGSGLPS